MVAGFLPRSACGSSTTPPGQQTSATRLRPPRTASGRSPLTGSVGSRNPRTTGARPKSSRRVMVAPALDTYCRYRCGLAASPTSAGAAVATSRVPLQPITQRWGSPSNPFGRLPGPARSSLTFAVGREPHRRDGGANVSGATPPGPGTYPRSAASPHVPSWARRSTRQGLWISQRRSGNLMHDGTMDAHSEADRLLGPCNDPDCPTGSDPGAEWITYKQAAQILGVTHTTVGAMIKDGRLVGRKLAASYYPSVNAASVRATPPSVRPPLECANRRGASGRSADYRPRMVRCGSGRP